jgi:hypothetical protein
MKRPIFIIATLLIVVLVLVQTSRPPDESEARNHPIADVSRPEAERHSRLSRPPVTGIAVDTPKSSQHSTASPTNEEVRAYWEAREAAFQAVVALDTASGINTEVRERESDLRSRLKQVQSGALLSDVISIMGTPHMVIALWEKPGLTTVVRIASVEEAAPDVALEISYWPRVGVPFDGRNGQGYKVLHLRFDATRSLRGVEWRYPGYTISGSLNMVMQQREYWRGKHEVSGPPESGAF